MIEIASETLLTLKEAAGRFPPSRAGRPTHAATIFRLIQSRKLEGIRLGGRWVTSLEAIQRYADRETRAALGDEPAPEKTSDRMTAAHRHRFEIAERYAESKRW
jgi:hypothetical protein